MQENFEDLYFWNFSESFSKVLLSYNPARRSSKIDILQEYINDSNIEETSKTQINDILDKFKKYPKC
jgi:predicted CopG family antitoxin